MEEIEAGGGGNPSDHFHRNEAISAVADDGFIVEEDDDYEDLYNDVNVGENVLESLRKNEDNLGHRTQEVQENMEKSKPTPPPQPQLPPQDEGPPYPNAGTMRNSSVTAVGVGSGPAPPAAGGGFRVELAQASNKVNDIENVIQNNPQMIHHHQHPVSANVESSDNARNMVNVNGTGGNVYGGDFGVRGPVGGADGSVGGGGTILFVGDLHWWTTDADLESELCKYGPVKEVKFFDERASGKSKGYCQVEFYDPGAATTCKEGMNGHIFNGRPCVVAYASPFSVKRMGEAQVNRNQQQMGTAPVNQPWRDSPSKPGGVGVNLANGGNQGGGDNSGRGFGRGSWGRGNAMGNRGPMGRNRGGRGLVSNGNGFGQGIGAGPPMMHHQAMMGQGFDPAFGGPMGRMGGYGGFPGAPAAPFSGIYSSFGPMGNVGLPGVAPHVNPAFFGRGMPGMGMPTPGVEGPNMGMWSESNMGGWAAGDEHGGRAGESSYGEEAASDHQYVEGSQERGPWPNSTKEKERDWSGSSEKRYRDDRGSAYDREKDFGRDRDWSERRLQDDKDAGRDRDRDRDRERDRSLDRNRGRERERSRDRDRYADHNRHRNRGAEYDDDYDKGRSSRTHSKSRVSHEDEHKSRSRDADYGKRRR